VYLVYAHLGMTRVIWASVMRGPFYVDCFFR